MSKKILILPGDGIGQEVTSSAIQILEFIIDKFNLDFSTKILDVGGTADSSRVEKAFRLILQDSNVKAILVNIFGGIVRCDRVAEGIVSAYKNIGNIDIPIIVRLQGTNSDKAKEIIDSSGLNVLSAIAFDEAANKVQTALN